MNRTVRLCSDTLVDLGSAVLGGKLLLVDCALNAILLFLFEGLLILEEFLLRSRLAVLLLHDLRRKRAVLQLGVDSDFALLLDAGETALLPLFEAAIVVLLILEFALQG